MLALPSDERREADASKPEDHHRPEEGSGTAAIAVSLNIAWSALKSESWAGAESDASVTGV